MSPRTNPWLNEIKHTVNTRKHLLANLSVIVRTSQFALFSKLCEPKKNDLVLDVGISSDETLKDTNLFEKLYPYKKNITAVTIEDEIKLKKLYPHIKVVKVKPGERLPFKDKAFSIATSWATLEHVGYREDQSFFLAELCRVAKRVFVTVPYRYCVYEPHTEVFFLHWLPNKLFKKMLRLLHRDFWGDEAILNMLSVKDVVNISKGLGYKIYVYKMFGILPSHLIIYKK